MNTIIVLSHNHAHFRHYAHDFQTDKNTRLLNPHCERELQGVEPCAIIRLPEWWLGKDDAFMRLLDHVTKRMMK